MPDRGRRSLPNVRVLERLVSLTVVVLLIALLFNFPDVGGSGQTLAAADASTSAPAPSSALGSDAASAASSSVRPRASVKPPASAKPPVAPSRAPSSPPASDPPSSDPPPAAAALSPDCATPNNALDRANELMANEYRFGQWAGVRLPSNLSWTENPFHDNNWAFQEHSLRWVLDLFTANRKTGDTKYRDRGIAVIQDWIRDNPRVGARSPWAWNDHSTALRAVVMTCAADLYGMPSWLRNALTVHGRTLADESFYRHEGNHALNQSIALLEVGRVLKRGDWKQLAEDRINTLLSHSVDSQGVINEQSVGYEHFNYGRYSTARARLVASGMTPGSVFHRLDLMPRFLAFATLPTGHYEMIGDTFGGLAPSIKGTVAEYAATTGASGPKPKGAIARYNAGYLFVHSGWGEQRAPTDETFFATKWGPGPVFHGHSDGLELTLTAWGSRLLLDTGVYSYTPSPFRNYFKTRPGHNVVTVDGMTWNTKAATKLVQYHESPAYVDIQLQASGYSGVTHTRRITYSRGLDFLVVEDKLTSSSIHTYRQLWHFPEDAKPAVGASTVWTQRAKGNVLVRQLLGSPAISIVKGRSSPVQGWVSYVYGKKVAAPVEEAVQRGRSVRYITLIAPAAGKPNPKLSNFRATAGGYTVTVTVGAHSERLTVNGTSIALTPLS